MIGTNADVAQAILDITAPTSGVFPTSVAEASTRWGEVAETLGANVVPASDSALLAKNQFVAVLGTMSGATGLIVIKAAFMAYATTLASGMTASGFTGVPPTSPPAIETVLIGTAFPADVVANGLAVLLTAWMRTGSAVNIATGATVPWT